MQHAGEDALALSVTDMLPRAAQLTPVGSYMSYSNLAVTVCGLVVEAVTGQSYEAAVRELVLAPLGMDASLGLAEAGTVAIDLDHPDLRGVEERDVHLALATCASAGVVTRAA